MQMLPRLVRRMAIGVSLPAVVVLAALEATPGKALACTCVRPSPPDETKAMADAVFSGTVSDSSPTGDGNVIYTFEPTVIWKGQIQAVIEVSTAASAATCGDFFDIGVEYIVYAYLDENGALTTNMCTRNAPYDADEAAALGSPIWPPSKVQTFIRGDTSGDLKLDIADAITVLTFLFQSGATIECLEAADANDDGKVDVTDPIALLDYEFQGGSAPPAPFTACGADPTSDALGCVSARACQ